VTRDKFTLGPEAALCQVLIHHRMAAQARM